MSLERKDIRAKLDPDTHAQLKAICDVDGVDMGDFIEACVLPVVQKRVHDAMVLTDALQRQGITGNNRESPGVAGNAHNAGGR